MASDSAPEEAGSTLDYMFESVTFGMFSPTKAAADPDQPGAAASGDDDAPDAGFLSHMWSNPKGASDASGEGGDNTSSGPLTRSSSRPTEMDQAAIDAHAAAVSKVAHTDVQRRGSVNTGGFLFFDTEMVTLMCTILVQSHARGMFARRRVRLMREEIRERAARERAALIAAEEMKERAEKRAQLKQQRLKESVGEGEAEVETAGAQAPSPPPSSTPTREEMVVTPPKTESARLLHSMQSAPASLDARSLSERSAVATPRSAPVVSSSSDKKIYVGGMVQTKEVKLQQANHSAATRRASSYTRSHATTRSPGPEMEHLFMGGIKSDSAIHFSSRGVGHKSKSLGPRCRAVSRDEDGVLSTPRIKTASVGDEEYYSDLSDDDGGFTIVLDDDPVRANAPDSMTRGRGKSTEKQFQRFVASPQQALRTGTPRSRESSFTSQASQSELSSIHLEAPYDPASPRNAMPVRRMSLTPVQWEGGMPISSPPPPGNKTGSRLDFDLSPVA